MDDREALIEATAQVIAAAMRVCDEFRHKGSAERVGQAVLLLCDKVDTLERSGYVTSDDRSAFGRATIGVLETARSVARLRGSGDIKATARAIDAVVRSVQRLNKAQKVA